MNIYYSSSIRNRECLQDKGRKVGIKQWVDWRFEYLGRSYIIPCIYRFNEGIVIDILQPLNQEEIEAFIEKYKDAEDRELTRYEEEQIEREHPCRKFTLREIWLNGKCINHIFGSSSAQFLAGIYEEKCLLPLKEAYKAYLGACTSFSCQRVCINYPTSRRKKNRIKYFGRRQSIKTLKFNIDEEWISHAIEKSFLLGEEEAKYQISFTHPITGMLHDIKFDWEEAIEIPMPRSKEGKVYGQLASYCINPSLEAGEWLEFDNTTHYEKVAETRPEIMGGADGPTAIFITGKSSFKHYDLCYSTLSSNPTNKTFQLQCLHTIEVKEQTYSFNVE